MTTIQILLPVVTIILAWKNMIMSFKIGYYEQTFKNHKSKFSKEKYNKIEDVMKKKHPF